MAVKSGIRGISEERRTPRIGKVRLGIQVKNRSGNGTHPEMTDHFVFDKGTPAGDILYQMFGEECRSLPISFPNDDPRVYARRNLEMWGAATLKCRGDGETAEALVNVTVYDEYMAAMQKAGGEIKPPPANLWASTSRAGAQQQGDQESERLTIPCLGLGYDGLPPCPKFDVANGCGASMHLTFIIRGFPGLGTFQLDTGSVTNIQRIDDFLEHLGNYTNGRFAGLPLWMHLEPYQMKGRTFYGLRFDVDFAAMEVKGLGALPQLAQLTAAERIIRYLPPESQDAPPQALIAGAGTVDDEAPGDRVIEGEIVTPPEAQDHEEADPPRGWHRRNAPIDEDAEEAAADDPVVMAKAWLDACAIEIRESRADVLKLLNVDIAAVAADLPRFTEVWKELRADRQAPAVRRPRQAASSTRASGGPSAEGVRSRPMLIAWAKSALQLDATELVQRLGLDGPQGLDEIAEEKGGWPEAAAEIQSILQPQLASAR